MATKEFQGVNSHGEPQEACLSPLERIVTDSGTLIAKDTVCRAICAWALLLGQYEGSENVHFAFQLGSVSSQFADIQPPRKIQPWFIKTNYSLDWHLSELFAYVRSSTLNAEKTDIGQNDIDEARPSNPSSIRTLLVVTRGLPVGDTNNSIGDQAALNDRFDLVTTIVVDERGEFSGADCRAQGYFAPEQARVIQKQLDHVLALVSLSQDCRLRELKMVCDADFRTILEWNKDLPVSVPECVDDIIYRKASLNPSAEAIHASDGSMNYQDLISISGIVAENLQVHGIGTGSVVPLYFEKSKWVVVGILAVIKTGATFLLLDPSHPPKRLRYMTETAQAHVILCSTSQARTGAFGDLPVLVIDHLLKPLVTPSDRDSNQSKSTPESDLYIMFTSGTTGRPKSFAIQHRAFCASATARAPLIKRDSKSRVLQFCAFSFDPCMEDILTTLMFGGCICIPSEHERLNDLAGFMRRANANVTNVTPGVIDLLEPDDVPCLKVLILSGEAMKKRHIDTWAGRLNLMNGYGPSECCIKCALNPSVTIGCDPKNIGRAVGSVLWIVDALHHERLAPIGAVGELLIEGPSLSRGYLDKEATQKAFMTAPKWLADLRGDPATRLYRTGDLVKYNVDGSITFIGRRDTQVKIRGQRIELEEVEKTITESLPVGWRVVSDVVRFLGSDEPTLAAFLYRKPSTHDKAVLSLPVFGQDPIVEFPSSIADLVGEAKKSLPSYMVPEAFIPVRHIPLTVHGKTDRAAIRLQASKLRRPIIGNSGPNRRAYFSRK